VTSEPQSHFQTMSTPEGISEVQMLEIIWIQEICPHSSKPSCPVPSSRSGVCSRLNCTLPDNQKNRAL